MDLSRYEKNWRELIRPKRLEVDKEVTTETYGRFIIEPLERGYGITLGNSLRRVLLSSIRGAAITSVRIDGCLHEFSVIPGVREDVTEIILNLKGVRFKMEDTDPKTVRIEERGPKEVKAGDIQCPAGIEVVNPDHYIATLDKDAILKMEMTVKMGRGYVPAERNKEEDAPIGTISMDAIFSPVRKVNYTVTPTRVGHITDYDRLILEVWTDGTITPLEAVGVAAKILQEQLRVFVELEAEIEEEKPLGPVPAEETDLSEILSKTVDELEISARSVNALKAMGIIYIGQLVQKGESELLQAKNFGRKSLEEIKTALSKVGLNLGMEVDFTPPEVDTEEEEEDEA